MQVPCSCNLNIYRILFLKWELYDPVYNTIVHFHQLEYMLSANTLQSAEFS